MKKPDFSISEDPDTQHDIGLIAKLFITFFVIATFGYGILYLVAALNQFAGGSYGY